MNLPRALLQLPGSTAVALVAVLYYAAARLGLLLAFADSNASPVWPPSGLALAAVLLLGTRVWPGIFVGAFAANFAVFAGNLTTPLGTLGAVSGAIALGNTLEALAGAWLFRRWLGAANALNDGAAVMRFVGVAGLMCGVSAGIGSVSLLVSGVIPSAIWGTVALTWWIGDVAGVLILTPALLGLVGGSDLTQDARRRRETAGLLLALILVAAVPFGGWLPRGLDQALMFLLFPAFLWPVFRLSQRAAAGAVVCVSFMAIWQTVNGAGPFYRDSLNQSLLLLQGFVCVIAITIHALAAALAERRRVAAALMVSEDRLRKVTETLPQLIWTCLSDGWCDYLGPQWVAYTGIPEAQQLGFGWVEQLHPEDRAHTTARWAETAGTGQDFDVEFRIRRHDGVYRWFKTRAVPLRDPAGAILKWFGSNTDIEELRLAEKGLRQLNATLEQRVAERTAELQAANRQLEASLTERKQAEAALASSEALLRQFVQHAPAAVAMLDREMRYLQTSDRWLTDFPQSGPSLIGRSHYEVVPDLPARWKECHRRVLAGAVESSAEEAFQRADGTILWIQWEVRPWRQADGQVGGMMIFTQIINDRKRAEFELRDNRERFELAACGAVVGIWDWNVVTGDDYFSDRWCALLGYAPDELKPVADTWVALLHPEDKERVFAAVQAHFDQRTPYDIEYRLRTKAGEYLWVQATGQARWDAAGKAVRMAGSITDITARQRMEQLLGWEKNALERLASAASLAEVLKALVLGLEGQAPGALCSVLLLDADGIHLRHGAAPSLPEDYNRLIDGVAIGPAVGSCGTAAFANRQVIVADIATDPLWADYKSLALAHGLRACWSTPITSSAGKVLGTLAIYYREPRQPTPAELELISRAQHLVGLAIEHKQGAEALRMMRFSVDRAGDSIFWISREGCILYVNDAACTSRGYSRAELLGMKIFDLDPDYQPGIWGPHFEILKRLGTITLETRHRAKDGLVFPVEVNANYVFINGQEFNFASLRDITVRKRIEQKQYQLSADLQRSNQELEQFAYVASHDLQEPLRAVAGCVQILRNRYQDKLDARADELIRHSVEGAERMQTLIADLLAFSSVGTQGMKPVPMESGAALGTALVNLRTALTESGATVTHDPLPPVVGDRTQLTQLFQNLVGNALKYRSPARPPAIHVSATRAGEGEGEQWRFAVRDNGLGIEPQYFARIFVIFQRLHTRAEYPGTGIGLALCKKIVERHGGRLWLESQPGEGTIFYFTLSAPA